MPTPRPSSSILALLAAMTVLCASIAFFHGTRDAITILDELQFLRERDDDDNGIQQFLRDTINEGSPSTNNHRRLKLQLHSLIAQYSNPSTVTSRNKASQNNINTEFPLFQTKAKHCDPSTLNVRLQYHSQSNEDKKLMHWFSTLCYGSYIEMGALDGDTFSNSHVFHAPPKHWTGVLIELNPDVYANLIINRPPSTEQAVVNAGVCATKQTLHYFSAADNGVRFEPGGVRDRHSGATSGIVEFAADTFVQKYWKNIRPNDPRIREVQCDTLDNVLREHTPNENYWDFFSLDVEGAEFSVLKSVDFNRVGFGIVFVEADDHNEMKNLAVIKLLEMNGYKFLEEFNRSYWFANVNFAEIYKDLL